MNAVSGRAPLHDEIAVALTDQTCAATPTVLQRLIAAAFARRVHDAVAGRGFLQLTHWTERTAQRYGAFPDVSTLLQSACPIALGTLQRRGVLDESFANDLIALAAIVTRTLAASPVAADAHDIDHVDEVIAALLVTLDDADPLTGEHSRAVSLWCRRIARRMALSDEASAHVARGGLLHDIGKTRTPKDILTAPRSLTASEYAIMQDHASQGAAIISEIEALRPYIPLVINHHERLDGRGYPNRLAAEQIALEVRIVTVADCFNAMIGRRPYRLPMTPAAALEQLVVNCETQFDPAVVEAMVDVVTRPG